MALIDLQKIDKQYSNKHILKNVHFTLLNKQRVAIIGQNGQGKSTLMKIITGEVEPDDGEVSIDKSLTIQMLAQQLTFPPNITVKDAIAEQLIDIKNTQKRYDEVSILLENGDDSDELLNESYQLITYLDNHNAWDIDAKVQKVMQEFDLVQYENKQVSLLSGGEQRRLSLAGLILKKPDILLLDEPTNHLDVYMVEFLEDLLTKENFALIFISHDRYFIDNVATSIIEIDNGKIRKFKGGYSKYLQQKEKLVLDMKKEQHNLVRKLKEELHWMQHGVSGRRKRNVLRTENYFELKKRVKANPSRINKMNVELQREAKSFNKGDILHKKKILFELEDINISLGGKKLITDFTTIIKQKDSIGIVGPNGCGKSTLIKILLERLTADSGRFKKAEFKIGYFDQHREMLDDDKTILQVFCPHGGERVSLSDGRNMHIFGYLKNFLFPREFLTKKIGNLSGGEKNRIALAYLFTKKMDCLILDEPTNDLDIPTINILEEYLINFQGAIIFCSHDRYFVDKIAKKLFIFKENCHIDETYIPYSEFLSAQKDELLLKSMEQKQQNKQTKNSPKKDIKKNDKNPIKLSYKQQRDWELLPAEIDKLEDEIAKLEICIQNPDCCEAKGLEQLGIELANRVENYEKKVESFLKLEEAKQSLL
ncbi:MAG: ABC transporter ATP-binding protein [Gammaproteobacteria bacterium]|nr:MAG: ABC transporter ATP-binding protein [Gammaproteobacteria bacterium]